MLGELVGLILTQLDRWPQVNKEWFDKLIIDGACVAISLGHSAQYNNKGYRKVASSSTPWLVARLS